MFKAHGQMHVPIHGNLDRGMSQHLAESLDLHTRLHTACGKGKEAVVSYDREIENDVLKKTVEKAGFQVVSITE